MTNIDGKQVAADIREELKVEIATLDPKPKLVAVLVGDDPASQVYVGMKEKQSNAVGMAGEVIRLPKESTQVEVEALIQKLNDAPTVNGILLQLPLPKGLDAKKAISLISPAKDVDGLNPISIGKLHLGQETFIPCTPFGIMQLFKRYNVDIEGKHAVVIGRSDLVGKPIARLLEQANATVTICHSRTHDLQRYTKSADILVAAVGRPKMITGDMIKDGAVVIDVGINRVDGKLVGDVDYESAKDVASLITPVPGGVGPMTIAMLLSNTVIAYKRMHRQ